MSRVDEAREAYLTQNLKEAEKSHSRQAVHQAVHHEEAHLTSFNLPEIILGGQDGLVNVLGVILGVAAATVSTKIVIIAGLSATFAESISMAAVAYTSKLAEADYYQSELEREKWEIEHLPEGEKEEIRALYENYGFKGKILNEITEKITLNKDVWLKVMMEQELGLEEIDRKKTLPTALLVGFSAVIGSLIPLIPFFLFSIKSAIWISLLVTAATLFFVGYYKAKKTLGRQLVRQATEMMVIGILSALVGYLVGTLLKL